MEITWYDFKQQALDLFHDIEIWSNFHNFNGIINSKNLFLGRPPRTDSSLDEVVNGAWYRRTFEEYKAIAGDEDF